MTSLAIPNRSVFLRVSDKINAALERHFWFWAVLFVVLFLASAIVKDIRTPMWIDELLTLHMSQQADAAEIVKATLDGADGAPPLYAMIVSAILPVVRNEALAVRLPSTLGYCGMVICLLAFCRRRLPAAYSMAAALLACYVCRYYSSEGRCYGVVLGCAAGALLCWQFAVEERRRILVIPLFAVCVALMTALHYYSMLFVVPLFLAELVRWRTSRKLDWGILAAMAPILLVLGVHYPLIAANARLAKHYNSPATWQRIPEPYEWYFVKILGMCILPVGVLAVCSTMSDDRSAKPPTLIPPEWVVSCAFSLMPFFVVVLSHYTTHVFLSRYVLWAVPGFAVLVAALLCRAALGRTVVGVSLLGLLVALGALDEARYLRHIRERPALRQAEVVRQALTLLPDGTEPIVVVDAHWFMELSYYADSRIRERLVYPVSRDLELQYSNKDIDSLVMTGLSQHTKLHIIDYDAVVAAQPRFFLAANTPLPWDLIQAGYRVVRVGSGFPYFSEPVLFEVEAPGRK
jgi:Dolichyl-phosphate-mannose-protein mannosyltransferase